MPLSPELRHDLDWQETKKTDDFYEDAARYFDIVELIIKCSPKKVLDVGCGSGYIAKLLKSRLPELTIDGIDISRIALQRAEEHLHEYWQLNIDKEDLPLESDRYNTAICIEVLEHLYDPEHALNEIYRVLQSGGHGVLTVPNLAYWRFRLDLFRGRVPFPAADPRHLHQYDLASFKEALLQVGFKIIKMSGHGVRFSWLAKWKPSLFSDILIATVMKF